MAYTTPKTNWQATDVVLPTDMNRIEQNTVELKKAATIDIVDAGNKITATNVEDALQEIATDVQTGKSSIATAITAMGQSAAGTDTFTTLANKIRDISDDATAAVGDVLTGKTFYQGGSKKTGTMVNNGAGGTVTPGTSNIVKPAGYYSSSITILGDTDLQAGNILAGVNIFGVAGNQPKVLVGGNTIFVTFSKGTGTGSVLTSAGYIQLSNNSSNILTAVTDNTVNVTGFTKLLVNAQIRTGLDDFFYFGLTTSRTTLPSSWQKYSTINLSDNTTDYPRGILDISTMSGNYYIGCGTDAYSTANYIYEFILIP